jgi:cell division septum initiation protein DivIVA
MNDKCKDNCDELDFAAMQNDNADLRKKVDAFDAQIKDLTAKAADSEKKAKDANDILDKYIAAEKSSLVDSISKRSEFKADELAGKTVEELRVISVALDKAKPPEGTVKNVRGADGAPARSNVMADGRIDATKSLMGSPKRNADGSIEWIVK